MKNKVKYNKIRMVTNKRVYWVNVFHTSKKENHQKTPMTYTIIRKIL